MIGKRDEKGTPGFLPSNVKTVFFDLGNTLVFSIPTSIAPTSFDWKFSMINAVSKIDNVILGPRIQISQLGHKAILKIIPIWQECLRAI